MKVMQITAFSGWGCTGRIAEGIHNVLVDDGCESVIAWGRLNTAQSNVPTIKIGTKLDYQVHGLYTRLTDKCGFGSKYATKELLKEIDKFNPDIVHLHILHSYFINIEYLFKYLKEKDIQVVWTFHDCWAFTGHCCYFDLVNCEKWKTGCHECQMKWDHPSSWLIDNSKNNWIRKKELLCGLDKLTIVTPSKWLASLVKESFLNKCRVEVINNGINIENFKPTEGEVHKKYSIEGKKIVLGVSSSWVESKGLEDFKSLAEMLSDEYKVVLVGLNKKQIDGLPHNVIGIERTDSVRELAELYTAAHVFVNPTYVDNYPTTNLEALACGTPVITYDTGGSVEAVLESGVGAIVKKGDIEGLANAIMQIHKNPSMEPLFECNEKDNYKKYLVLYRQLLGDK